MARNPRKNAELIVRGLLYRKHISLQKKTSIVNECDMDDSDTDNEVDYDDDNDYCERRS